MTLQQILIVLTVTTWLFFSTKLITQDMPLNTRNDLRKALIALLAISSCIAWLSSRWNLLICELPQGHDIITGWIDWMRTCTDSENRCSVSACFCGSANVGFHRVSSCYGERGGAWLELGSPLIPDQTEIMDVDIAWKACDDLLFTRRVKILGSLI